MQSSQIKPIKPLKLGLVGPLPPPFGGMANQTNQLASLLKEEGVDVAILQTNAPYTCRFIENISGVRAVFRLLPYIWQLWKSVKKFDCLHVMANSGWSWQLYAAPAVWIGWLKNVPVIVNYRGGEAEKYFQASIKWIAPTLKKVSVVVVPSGFLKNVFNNFGFSAEVIPNIVDFQRFSFKGSTRLKNSEAPRLVIARNLEKIYGIDMAIKAVGILKPSFPAIKLIIAGSGDWHAELLEMVAEQGLAENIEFTGKLNPQQIVDLYANADIMLNPTTVDNMPNSVLEAMAIGMPVVTTNVGGIPYIVTDHETALFVDVNRPDMMAAKVEQLIRDPILYEKLVLNGIKQVKKYAWDVVKQQWLDTYYRVAL